MAEDSGLIVVDFETAMAPKYTLKTMSMFEYVSDPRFDVLCVSIAERDGDVSFYHKLDGNAHSLADAKARLATAAAAGMTLVAHNVDFEGMVLRRRWNLEFRRTFDTLGYLRFLGVRGRLENGARLVGLEKQKAPPFTEQSLRVRLREMMLYNMADVMVARRLALRALADPRFLELDRYIAERITQENLRGLSVDRQAVDRLVTDLTRRRGALLQELCARFADFDTNDLNRNPRVIAYAQRRWGVTIHSLDRKDSELAALRKGQERGGLDAFLRLREDLKTVGNNLAHLRKLQGEAARVYAGFTFYSAHTGRHASGGEGAGRINLHSLPKGNDRIPELKRYREVFVPDANESWVAGDLSTIEPRVTARLAGQENLLEQFRLGEDVYIWFGRHVFPDCRIVKNGENDHLRGLCKQAVIGLGYGMGLRKFRDRVLSEMPDTEEPLIEKVFTMYRGMFPLITRLRKGLFNAFWKTAVYGIPHRVGHTRFRRIKDITGTGNTVAIVLPTGRALFYRGITRALELVDFGDGRKKQMMQYRYDPRLEVPGVDGMKAKRLGERINATTIVENVVQGISRDILMAYQEEMEREHGLHVRFTVHDEAVASTGRCRCPRADAWETADRKTRGPVECWHEPECPWAAGRRVLQACMSRPPARYPLLRDLPIACEVSSSVRQHYGK